VPAKEDTATKRKYYDKIIHPLMRKAKQNKLVLLFLDASHFVMGCDFLGYIYGITRRFVKTFSGRKRYNVLGALNFVTKEVITVTNDTYITAVEVCDILRKIATEYRDNIVHIVLDNARYQKCEIVTTLAKELGITLDFLPAYSPNLSLIERLWKYVKSRLHSKYYNEFEEFKKTIDTIIGETSGESKSKIDTLIGEPIQIFDKLIPINENTYVENNTCKETSSVA
jgi:transposase